MPDAGSRACQPKPRTHSRVKVEGTDEGASQRYLALTALKAPQNLPQHAPDLLQSYLTTT